MFKLIDGTELTEEIKDAFKKKVTKAYIKLKDGTILSGENFLKSLEIEDLRYNEETNNFLGEAVAKRATVDLYNKDNAINVEDEEFEAFIGAELSDGTTAWISYGNFIVQKPENDDTKEDTVIEAFDYMCKFNKTYTPGVTFPCTYADIVEDICEQCGVELANRDFRNAEKVVKENFFINGEQCRAVLKQVAKIAFSWARVGNDNKLYIDFKNKDIEESFENFDLDSYIDLNKNNQLIPVDTIVLRNSAVESENVTIRFDKNAKINKFIGDMEQDTIEEVAGTTVESNSVHVTDVDLDFETEVLPMGAIEQDTIAEVAGTTVEGSSIHVTDVNLNYETKVLPMGTISQETRSGKNLLNVNFGSNTINGVTATNNNDGTITLNGTPTRGSSITLSSELINVNPNEKITIKHEYISGSFTQNTGVFILLVYPSQSGNGQLNVTKAETQTKTLSLANEVSNKPYIWLGYDDANQKPYVTFNNYTFRIQVEKGEVATDFEQFGQMPSLNYPSDAKGVGSANLAPIQSSEWEQGGIMADSGYNNDQADYINIRIRTKGYIPITLENYLIYIGNLDSDIIIGNTHYYDKNKTWITTQGAITGDSTGTKIMLTPPSNAAYCRLQLLRTDKTSAISVSDIGNVDLRLAKNINLFDISKITEDYYISGSNGNLVTSTKSNTSDFIKVKANKEYSISFDYDTLLTTENRSILLYDNEKQWIKTLTVFKPLDKKVTFTSPQDGYIRFSYDKGCKDIMVYEGTENLPYTSYGYCRYDNKIVNKNIFKPTLVNNGTNIVRANGTVTLVDDEYSLTATGTDLYFGNVATKGVAYTENRGTLYNVKGKTKLYFLITNSIFNKNYVTAYDSNKISLGFSSTKPSSGSYDIPANAEYISFRFGYGTATVGETYRTKVMLSFEPITDYVKHQSQTLPIDIPVGQEWYSGKPYKVGSKWYRPIELIKERITKVSQIQSTAIANKRRLYVKLSNTSLKTDANANLNKAYMNRYKLLNSGRTYNNEVGFTLGDATTICIYDEKYNDLNEYGTDDALKTAYETYLSENETYIVYELATPTREEITDTHLIEQLENIQSAELYEGVTNTNTYATVDEVADMPLSVKYNFITPSPSLDIPSAVKGVGSEKHINHLNMASHLDTNINVSNSTKTSIEVETIDYTKAAMIFFSAPNLKAGITYRASMLTEVLSGAISSSRIELYKTDKTWIKSIGAYSSSTKESSGTFTVDTDGNYLIRYLVCESNKLTQNIKLRISNVMLQDYTSGIVTPFTPYEYCRYETAVRNINLVDDVGIIKTGTHGGLTVAIENGKIIVNGTPTSNYPVISQGVNITNLLEDGETYTLIRFGEKGIYNQCSITNTNGTSSYVHTASVKSAKFTFNKATMKTVRYAIQGGTIANTGTLTNYEYNFMLVRGDYINTNVNYTPHQSQTLPIDIPMGQVWYSGKPYKAGSKWYRKVEFEKKTFDGTENWKTTTRENDSEPAFWGTYDNLGVSKILRSQKYCNMFKYRNQSYREVLEPCICENSNFETNLIIFVPFDDEITTVALWKAKLKELYDNGTPLYVLYELATPTVEEITDTHLIAQLEAIKAAELYEGVTNVNSYSTSDDVAEMPLSVRYNFVTPAPSLDRESPINVVTGACNLYNARGNLFDINDKTQVSAEVVFNPDDSITITYDNTNGTGTRYINCFTGKTNRLKENTKYYGVVEILNISGTGNIHPINDYQNQSQVLVNATYGANNFPALANVKIYQVPFMTAKDFGLSSIKTMVRSFVSFAKGQSGSITFRLSVFEQEQDLEKFVYKKFNSQQFPLDLGSLELLDNEYIYWKNNKWYKHKLIDKYDSNIDKEGWVAEAGNATGSGEPYLRFRKTVPNATTKQIRQAIISNRFVSTLDGKHPIGSSFTLGKQLFIYLPEEITTEDLLKEWFVSNPTIIYYYTDTPIEEEITDTTLLSQLNTIKDEFFLVEGENHIMFNCDNGTQPQLEIKHYPNKYSLKETISTGNDLTLNASYEHRELVVKEDYFAYNEETRRDLIESARELFGLTYLPVDLSGIGTAYLENNDLVTVTDKMGNVRPTYCLNHILKYNGVLYDTIAAPAMTETETKYQNESQEDLSRRRTEVIVNKATQEIQLVSEKVDTYDSRISEVEVGLDGIISKIESDIDITRTINGLKTLTLEECLEGDLLELHIYGNNQVFKRITPSGTTYPSNELIVKDDSLIKITRKEIDEEGNYISETSEIIDLKIKEVLRQLGDVADSFDLVNNKATLTRRIGVNTDNSLYVLTNPIVEDFGDLEIPLVRGTNIIEIVNYSAMMSAKYVIINAFTNTFATTVDLKSAIEILYNQINLEVSKKVNDDEIIARINMAILGRNEVEIPDDINKSIIEILANKISIKSDNFELTKDGTVTAKEGNIAGFKMLKPTNSTAWLVYDNEDDGEKYRSGFYQSNGFRNFLFAGLTSFNEEGTEFNFEDVPFEVTSNGVVTARYIHLNGESGFANVRFDSGKIAMSLTARYLDFRLDNNDNALFARFIRETDGFNLNLQNAPKFRINDTLHGRNLYTADANNGNRPQHYFVGQMWKDYDTTGTYYAVVTEQTCSCSDNRLKDNVKDSETSGLDRINKMQFRQFDWNKQSPTPDVHVDIGIIAQELKEIDENYVGEFTRLYNGEQQTLYNINDLNLITTGLKAIQELSAENNKLKETVDKQQKIIDFLINKLDCKDEISEILKEGE